jgi:2-polyprenyl-3-methyl-5-hydroxy-6-metoxy-1,4-benzoquinol methylase
VAIENEQIARLQAIVDDTAKRVGSLRLLEAGCGSSSRLVMPEGTRVIGIDISQSQLDRNTILNEKILGDIQTYPLEGSAFDVIICWDVLEHLSDPEAAVRNLVRAIRPGGSIILALPNLGSPKGLLTKCTPHWFHVWAYKHIFGYEHAGEDGYGPFPTHMRKSIAPEALRSLGAQMGLETTYFSLYEGGAARKLRERARLRGPVWNALKLMVKTLSLGRLNAEQTDCIIVLSRRP